MSQKINKNQRYILLDTNIISSFSNENLGEKILLILREAVGYGYGIAISDLTYFELLNEASPEKEAKMVSTLNGVTRFYIKRDILIAAAHLGSFYKEHGLSPDQFDPGDKIIASTAVLHNCIIFTLNGRDFPQPFFREIDRRMLDYQNKQWPVCTPSYFLEPQLEYIGQYHQKRIEPFAEKIKNLSGISNQNHEKKE
jgi:predicted nucleic acid-binding protein